MKGQPAQFVKIGDVITGTKFPCSEKGSKIFKLINLGYKLLLPHGIRIVLI